MPLLSTYGTASGRNYGARLADPVASTGRFAFDPTTPFGTRSAINIYTEGNIVLSTSGTWYATPEADFVANVKVWGAGSWGEGGYSMATVQFYKQVTYKFVVGARPGLGSGGAGGGGGSGIVYTVPQYAPGDPGHLVIVAGGGGGEGSSAGASAGFPFGGTAGPSGGGAGGRVEYPLTANQYSSQKNLGGTAVFGGGVDNSGTPKFASPGGGTFGDLYTPGRSQAVFGYSGGPAAQYGPNPSPGGFGLGPGGSGGNQVTQPGGGGGGGGAAGGAGGSGTNAAGYGGGGGVGWFDMYDTSNWTYAPSGAGTDSDRGTAGSARTAGKIIVYPYR